MSINLTRKKLTKIGGSFGFIVDSAFINNGMIEKNVEYDIDIKPTETDPCDDD